MLAPLEVLPVWKLNLAGGNDSNSTDQRHNEIIYHLEWYFFRCGLQNEGITHSVIRINIQFVK